MIARHPAILRRHHRLYATPRDLRRPRHRRNIRRVTIAAALLFATAAVLQAVGGL